MLHTHFKTPVLGTLILSASLLLTSCTSPISKAPSTSSEPLRRTEFMMGTAITLSLYDHQDDAILDQAFASISALEDALSINASGTLLQSINAEAGSNPVITNEALFDIVKKGLHYSTLTEGSFDMTVGPLVKLWNIGFPEARVPSATEIADVLPLIDYTNVVLDDTTQSIFLTQPGMMLDLGGIAKGYTADAVVTLLQEAGVTRAIIDLGGNIYTLGDKAEGTPWTVGVQDPFNPRGEIIGSLPTANQSIVTSGIYERYLEHDGIRYHHILDPSTGYPFTNDIAGVTIISDDSIDGDALSTAVFSKGIADGIAFVNTLSGIDAIFISVDKEVYVTDGLKAHFKLTNDAFTLMP